MSQENQDYGLSPRKEIKQIAAPPVEYKPPRPKAYQPRIGLIGTGGISELHLKAYRACGYDVVALASRTRAKAEARRDAFYPDADAYDDPNRILDRDDIDVVDVTPHPNDRLPILYASLKAGKHVLSQKPFVLDLDDGEALVRLAQEKGVKLAVNQNGRWAPHFSYLRSAVASSLIGDVTTLDLVLHWDQTWIQGNREFEKIHHLVLFDFAVHWFDIAQCIMAGRQPQRVFAVAMHFDQQLFGPPALASAIIEYPGAQVRMAFNAHTRLGEEDVTTVVGTQGTLRTRGSGLNDQPAMSVYLPDGQVVVPLEGCWFESGFQGSMGELLCAIEENRQPYHSAANNLKSLELCFAALASADSGQPVKVGTVRSYSN
ncbi:MAG: Gfo/Idh/MocA family oxidoreductase [Pirellulales bacterium]|nr:Gfo/Idh/MocA family oxidoreductase [Pirellulales bacterium]